MTVISVTKGVEHDDPPLQKHGYLSISDANEEVMLQTIVVLAMFVEEARERFDETFNFPTAQKLLRNLIE